MGTDGEHHGLVNDINDTWRTVSPPRQGSAWGDGQGRAPPPKAPPTPRLARNFFIKAPSPYAAYFFVFGP